MKNFIIAAIGLGLCLQAGATTLTTADGATYDNITSQRVDPDGLYIEYTTAGGGIGMSKVKFSRLSEDLQKQYGYNAANATAYTTAVAKANEDYRQESIKWDQQAQSQRALRESQDLEMEKVMTDRMIAMAQIKQQQNAAPPADGGYGYGYGGELIGTPAIGAKNHNKQEPAREHHTNPFARLNRFAAKP